MSDLICEDSHLCFGRVPEPAHKISHLCFGKRYRPNFLPIEVAALTPILTSTVDQLAILAKTLPFDKKSMQSEEFRDISERYGGPLQSPRKYPEMAGRWSPATEAMLKIQGDCLFAKTVLDNTMKELLTKGSFGSLRTSLNWQSAMHADEQDLLSQHKSNQENANALSKQLREEKQNIQQQAVYWGEKHELFTSNVHDTQLNSGLTTEFARRWENTRRYQHGLLLGREEEQLRETRDRLLDTLEPDEERVHTEIMRFLVKDTEVLKRDLDHWTDQYDAEMIQRETDLMRMRSSREQQLEQHQELKLEVARRQGIIQEIAVLRKLYEEKQRALANIVAIQSWWRGVSFRAKLAKERPKRESKVKAGLKSKRGKGKNVKKGKHL